MTIRPESTVLIDACSAEAVQAGVDAGVAALVTSGAAVLGANHWSSGFRKYLGVSGKVAMVVIPTSFAYTLVSELTLFDAKREPEKYGIAPDGGSLVHASEQPTPVNVVSSLGPHHLAANWAFENPFKVLAAAGVPVVGSIFWGQSSQHHLKLSQKVCVKGDFFCWRSPSCNQLDILISLAS